MLRSRALGPDGKELNFYNTSGYDLVRLAQTLNKSSLAACLLARIQ